MGKTPGDRIMSRCQHCNKLTHSEHLDVFYDPKDSDKLEELSMMKDWVSKWNYRQNNERVNNPYEYGKLKIGDIWIHFIAKNEKEME
jgi:hypothetical protein